MGFLTFKNLILIPITSIFFFLIIIYIFFVNKNLILNNKLLPLGTLILKRLIYYRSNFVGKTFSSEALILMTILGLIWSFYLYVYKDLDIIGGVLSPSAWSIYGIYLFFFLNRIILFHFFFYLIGLKYFKSWVVFRYGFLFYLALDFLSPFFGYRFFDLYTMKAYVYFCYNSFPSWFFGVNMSGVNFVLAIYYFSVALFFAIPFLFFFAGLFVNFFKDFNADNLSLNNFFNFFKSANFREIIKNSFNAGMRYLLKQNTAFMELIFYFFIWSFLFVRIVEISTTVFHGPYFVLTILSLIIKIFTFNYCLFPFLIWSALFNTTFFWFKNFYNFDEIRAFLTYIYKYYKGADDTISLTVRLQNAFYIFISFVLPIFMVFDVSLISSFIYLYLFLIEDVQFWVTFFIILTILYIFVLSLMPNNDPEHQQSNSRLFCVWIFNLSILISLFFLNSTILYVTNAQNNSIGLKTYIGDTVFTSLSAAVDASWINVAGEPLTGFLPTFSSGVFTFGYDYFAIILCLATSIIFSLIFLYSLFSSNLNRKRYFFINLLFIEICVLFAFLNLNLLGFFVFFESSLVPMFLIIGLWGSSDRRWSAAKQMLFYSLTSSTPMIVCMVHLYFTYGSLDYAFLYSMVPFMSNNEKFFVWLSFFLMFATKIPMFPFHSWLLNAHVEAPTGGSIILAAILLKLGIFGMVRYLFQFFNEISVQMAPIVISLALISVLYSSVCAVTELDSKKLIAHTSIAHMNISVIGLFIFDERGFMGAIYLSIGHVVTSAALFFLIGILYDRFHTRNLLVFGGLVQIMPVFSSFLFFFVMANSGFPWTLSFIGEFLVLAGVARKLSLLVYLILIISSVCLLYANLRLFMFICFGTINKNFIHNSVSDLTFLELYCVILLTLNGFVLMWNSSLFFNAFFNDNLLRLIF